MKDLARLHEEHWKLDARMTQLELLLEQPERRHSSEFDRVLDQLLGELPQHIRSEERSFYIPLKASGHARPELVERLHTEHEELLKTLEELLQFRRPGWSVDSELFLIYSSYLVELYREHTDQEHRWLFPLLEQLPRRSPCRSRRHGLGRRFAQAQARLAHVTAVRTE